MEKKLLTSFETSYHVETRIASTKNLRLCTASEMPLSRAEGKKMLFEKASLPRLLAKIRRKAKTFWGLSVPAKKLPASPSHIQYA
jgi:hypothetical protein